MHFASHLADQLLKQLPGASEQSYATLWYRRPLWNTVATNSGEEMELITKNVDKLLAINRELTRDHNPSRLLERIIDAAIALSGAERGFIILRQVFSPGEMAEIADEAHSLGAPTYQQVLLEEFDYRLRTTLCPASTHCGNQCYCSAIRCDDSSNPTGVVFDCQHSNHSRIR